MDSSRLRADLAVIGGGIVGLAHAYAAARAGKSVVLFERHPRALGASVRNFGLIWPIGQPPGAMLALALRSREIWLDVLAQARLPSRPTGSLHLAYRQDEAEVGRDFADIAPAHGYGCQWLDADAVLARSPAAVRRGLLGGLWSGAEITVDPRLVLASLPGFLASRFGVQLRYGAAVRSISLPFVEAGLDRWQVQRAIVCSGDDFETLYPAVFLASGITRCKLQMLRTPPQPGGWAMGPALAAGLTLRFYAAFRICESLPKLEQRIASEMPDYERWGIHVMASQNPAGEITLGDSHEYGLAVDIFDNPEIDGLILRYLASFAALPDARIAARWHGVYAKHPRMPYFTASPEPGVRIVTALGGAGMTLSFGLAEKIRSEMEAE